MLEIVSAFKQFGQTVVVDNLSFSLPKNKITSIIGGSGTGKSTLLKILGLLIKPDKGDVFFNNQSTVAMSADQRAQIRLHSIGFIFQELNLIPYLTALENIMLPALLAKASRETAQKKAQELLETFAISEKATTKSECLSGGQEQRVAMARALINSPEIIIGDEPTASLDKKNKFLFMDYIQKINRDTGQTFLIVTHDPEVANISNEIFRMEDGRLYK